MTKNLSVKSIKTHCVSIKNFQEKSRSIVKLKKLIAKRVDELYTKIDGKDKCLNMSNDFKLFEVIKNQKKRKVRIYEEVNIKLI